MPCVANEDDLDGVLVDADDEDLEPVLDMRLLAAARSARTTTTQPNIRCQHRLPLIFETTFAEAVDMQKSTITPVLSLFAMTWHPFIAPSG